MEDLGATLREARERRGLSLGEVERHLRIRSHLLDALERGDLASLPSEAQARGFVRNYAEFLGLDSQAILDVLEEGRRQRKTGPRPATGPVPTGPSVAVRSRRPRWLSPDLFIAAGVTLSVLIMLIWGGGRVMAAMRERTEAEVAASGFLVPTASTTPEPSAAVAEAESDVAPASELAVVPQSTLTPTATATFLLAAEDRVDLRILIQQRAWLSVLVDGEEVFRGRVIPGDLKEYQAESVIEILTSNGAALRILYEGEDQGVLGELGQVVRRLWSFQGALTATPTPSATASQTPRFAPTLTATATP